MHEETLWLISATDSAEDGVLMCVEGKMGVDGRISESAICETVHLLKMWDTFFLESFLYY